MPREPAPVSILSRCQFRLRTRSAGIASATRPRPSAATAFTTLSGEPIRPLYTPEDVGSFEERIGFPGEYPFTRGVYPSMYRGRLWTMRQFAGFGTAEETNERFRYLLDHGQTGLSTAFDMPSLMGHDSDHVRSLGEVGREGVAIDTLDDMQTLFGGIDLGEVTRVDDHQRAGGDHDGLLRGGGRGGGRARARAWAGRSRPTSSRSTSPRRSGASRSIRRCACSAT